VASDDQLRAHLLVIAEHARDALALLGEAGTLGGSLTLPVGSNACTHPAGKRDYTLGGNWTCQVCDYGGRDG
jgi:hypothetical protein